MIPNRYVLLLLAWFWSSNHPWTCFGWFDAPVGAVVCSFILPPTSHPQYKANTLFIRQKQRLLSSLQDQSDVISVANISTTLVSSPTVDGAVQRPAIQEYHLLNIAINTTLQPRQEIIAYDLTKTLQQLVTERGAQFGTLVLYNRHTTTSLLINEYEPRLLRDLQRTALQLIPPDGRSAIPGTGHYEHNDLQERPESPAERQRCLENGWDIAQPDILEQWRQQEPINAHAHLLSLMFGSNSHTIPVVGGTLQIGAWQSVLLMDFDGPRPRSVGVQLMAG